MIPFLFILFVALIGVFAVFGVIAARKRVEALMRFAQTHGLHFNPGDEYGIDDRYPEFGCFRQGSNRHADNLIYGTWKNRPILAFDYHYETHSTDSKGRRTTHHHSFSAVIVTSAVPLKPLAIRPEGLFDKLGSLFGFDDINFESAQFSGRFHVSSPDRKWAYDVLQPRSMQFLLDRPAHHIQFDQNRVLAYTGADFDGQRYAQALDTVSGILDGLPEYVVRQQTGT